MDPSNKYDKPLYYIYHKLIKHYSNHSFHTYNSAHLHFKFFLPQNSKILHILKLFELNQLRSFFFEKNPPYEFLGSLVYREDNSWHGLSSWISSYNKTYDYNLVKKRFNCYNHANKLYIYFNQLFSVP